MESGRGASHEREIGRRIARLREAAGLTQRELARRVGLTQSALSRIESGQRRLLATQAAALSHLLAVDPGLLLDLPPATEGGGEPDSFLLASASSPPADEPAGAAPPLVAFAGPHPALGDSRSLSRSAREVPARDDLSDLERASSRRGPGRDRASQRRRRWVQAIEPDVFRAVVADALRVESLLDEITRRPPVETASASAQATEAGSEPRGRFATPLPQTGLGDPARLARFWRHELGVGAESPLPDLVVLLEAAGVDVVHARLDDDTPHGAAALAEGRPFVFVNGRGRPVALQRFALAHEFAHLALGHDHAYDERIDWSGRSRRETDANAFAEEFVAPLAAVRQWFELDAEANAGGPGAARRAAGAAAHGPRAGSGPTVWSGGVGGATGQRAERGVSADVDLVLRLANHFGVSFWVARYRARAAGIVTSPTRLRELDQALRERQWQLLPRQLFLGGLRDTLSLLTAESRPGRERNALRMAPEGVRVPGRMRSQVLDLLERGVASLEQAAAWLRMPPADLRVQLEQLGIE